MALEDITEHNLHPHRTIYHASAVRKNNGKTPLFLCYFDGSIIISNGEAEIQEIITAPDRAGLIVRLSELKYQFHDGMN